MFSLIYDFVQWICACCYCLCDKNYKEKTENATRRIIPSLGLTNKVAPIEVFVKQNTNSGDRIVKSFTGEGYDRKSLEKFDNFLRETDIHCADILSVDRSLVSNSVAKARLDYVIRSLTEDSETSMKRMMQK